MVNLRRNPFIQYAWQHIGHRGAIGVVQNISEADDLRGALGQHGIYTVPTHLIAKRALGRNLQNLDTTNRSTGFCH
jgi:hypothetical protein